MNPLTLVKRIQKLNSREADLGISEDASWHAKYKDSAYVFVGGIPYDLTEGDLLAIFAQYGELVDVNLVRDKATGKLKGFAFIAYEDQRSTNLAVDNLNGAQILGRTIRVDHVSRYKKKEEEDEEEERQKREERGVCRAFQRGECTRGAGCKFSHDEQRAANTGWGQEEDRKSRSRLGNDRFEGFGKPEKRPIDVPLGRDRESNSSARHKENDLDVGRSRRRDDESHQKHSEIDYKDRDGRDRSRQVEVKEKAFHKVERDTRGDERNPSRGLWESHADENYHRREEKRSRHHDMEEYRPRENQDERDRDRQRDREKRSAHARDSSLLRNRHKEDDEHHYRSRR